MTDSILEWLETKHILWEKALKNITAAYMRDPILIRLIYIDELIGSRRAELEDCWHLEDEGL